MLRLVLKDHVQAGGVKRSAAVPASFKNRIVARSECSCMFSSVLVEQLHELYSATAVRLEAQHPEREPVCVMCCFTCVGYWVPPHLI
jgi:hypothetical protein